MYQGRSSDWQALHLLAILPIPTMSEQWFFRFRSCRQRRHRGVLATLQIKIDISVAWLSSLLSFGHLLKAPYAIKANV